MSSKPWFPIYVADYLADTQPFTTEQHGAYLLLLFHYWTNKGPITSKPSELKNIMRMSKHNFQKSSPLILKKFVLENEKYFHKRMDKEITKAIDLSNKRADAGRAGGKAIAQANDKQLPTQSQSQSHIKTTTRGTRLPELWMPDAKLLTWATQERPDLTITKTIASFRDYWHSKAGKDGSRIRWDLVFRNWVRNERVNHGHKQSTRSNQTPADRNAEATKRYLSGEAMAAHG